MERIMYPFKFNHLRLEDEEFIRFFKKDWASMRDLVSGSPMFSLMQKLKRLNFIDFKWERDKKFSLKKELSRIERELEDLYAQSHNGTLVTLEKRKVMELEARKLSILKLKGKSWRQKSKAVSLEKGDLNIKIFHSYTDNRRAKNSIWELNGSNGL
jgi:hypothetical protein